MTRLASRELAALDVVPFQGENSQQTKLKEMVDKSEEDVAVEEDNGQKAVMKLTFICK